MECRLYLPPPYWRRRWPLVRCGLPLRNSVLVSLSHASYALYMIHVPILVLASIFGIAAVFGWLWLPMLMLASCLIHFRYAEPVRRYLLYRHARPALNQPQQTIYRG